MDWGPDAMLDTIETLRGRGIATVGAGRNLEEAREPAILDKKGVRVAFLAYCSVLREGYAAKRDKPGVAPLRVHTYYESAEYQPGMPPRTKSNCFSGRIFTIGWVRTLTVWLPCCPAILTPGFTRPGVMFVPIEPP